MNAESKVMAVLQSQKSSGSKDTTKRLFDVITAWEKMRPTKSFYSMSLQEFKGGLKPYTEALVELADLEAQVSYAIWKRDAAAPAAIELLKGVVSAVKGDREEGGENGPLYSAMGYIPIRQRASGLVRRRKEEPASGGSSESKPEREGR